MNETTDIMVQSRKRCFSSNKRISDSNDFHLFNELEQNYSFGCSIPKVTKFEKEYDNETNFTSTYFAPPGECTRSKTIKSFNINPFDLSRPDSEENNTSKFICSTPLSSNASSKSRLKSQWCWNKEFYQDSGCDTSSVSESILSFASRSHGDESNTDSQLSQESWSTESLDISAELKMRSSPVKACSDTGYLLPIMSDSTMNKILIPEISSLTLANILSGNHTLSNKITMFDCRFPYEYSGGHVMNSINVYTCQNLLQTLFPVKDKVENRNMEEDINKMTTRPKRKLKKDDTIYIFYCEFSSYRGPKLAQCLRGLDRLANSGSRDLYFPHIYVLNNGYHDFFSEYPQFCSPNGYVSMKKSPYSLRNINPQTSKTNRITAPKAYRKELLQYEKDMRNSDKTLKDIITKRTKDSDILQLFSSHSTVGGI